MARAGSFGQEEINSVADQLVAEGTEPTIVRVRERVGGGSATTINRYLKVWREARPVKKSASVEIPSELSILLTRIIEQSRSGGRAEIESELARVSGELETISESAEKMETEIAELVAKNTSLTAERDQKDGRIAELEKAKKEQIDRLENEKTRLEKELDSERSAKESLRTELSTFRLKTESLEAENKDLLDGRKIFEQKIDSLRESLNASEKDLAIEREKIRSTLEAKSEREVEIERLRSEHDRMRTQHQKDKEALESLHSREVARLVSELERIRNEHEVREKKLELKIENLEIEKAKREKEAQEGIGEKLNSPKGD
jgi:chromosome segregation ATPase